jgi:uncharacterized OsmC-like protein
MTDGQVIVSMEQIDNFEFRVKFAEGMELLMDEPEPLGHGKGPNPSRVLSAAIGNCLSASLLFCLQKARVYSKVIKTTVTTTTSRNDKGRIRISGSKVSINVEIDQAEEATNRINKCLELFEDFCVVTQSVRNGIEVEVEVIDQHGKKLVSPHK